MPAVMALPLSRGMASLRDMQETLTLADCMDMMEVIAVDNYNARLWQDWSSRR